MKKVILTVAAVFAFGFANAQEEAKGEGFSKGDVFISGSVGFGTTKTGDAKNNSFDISPRAAYFVTENIAVGVKLGYTSEKDEPNALTETKVDKFTVGAFGRYYFTPASKFSMFGQLGFDYNNSKVTNTVGGVSTEGKVNGFDVALAPGVSYFVSKNFALEATFGELAYKTSKPDADGAESTNNFGLNVNMASIKLGLVYKF